MYIYIDCVYYMYIYIYSSNIYLYIYTTSCDWDITQVETRLQLIKVGSMVVLVLITHFNARDLSGGFDVLFQARMVMWLIVTDNRMITQLISLISLRISQCLADFRGGRRLALHWCRCHNQVPGQGQQGQGQRDLEVIRCQQWSPVSSSKNWPWKNGETIGNLWYLWSSMLKIWSGCLFKT